MAGDNGKSRSDEKILKVSFKDRQISEAPLNVLKSLYYYTAHYGLSVRQFTGRNLKYWEKLPILLRESQDNPRKLKKIIKDLEHLAAKSEERLLKRRAQVQGKWGEKEVILNSQLISVLCAIPEVLLAIAFRKLTDGKEYPRVYRVVQANIRDDTDKKQDFVEPDLLLLGEKQLLMVEVKTKGGTSSSRKYPPTQLLNYLRLVAACQDSPGDGIPTQFLHLILVPTTELIWLEKNKVWINNYSHDNGLLSVDPKACLGFARGFIKKNPERFHQLIIDTPVYYHSWTQLADSYESALRDFNDDHNRTHWINIGKELAELALKSAKYA